MAQRTVLVDDIDGGEVAETVSFGLDGAFYEIDLSQQNAAALRDALASWVGHARRVSGRASGPTRPGRRSASGASDSGDVRQWARSNGHQVSDRGRISAKVMQAYADAH